MGWLDSSNPAIGDQFHDAFDGVMQPADRTTMNGVIAKTGMLSAIAVGAGSICYGLTVGNMGVATITWAVGMIASLVVFFAVRTKPARAKVFGPIYALGMGGFLGSLTSMLDQILAAQGISTMPLGLQAFIITGSLFFSMLGLYRAGLLKPTRRFTAVLSTVTLGIMVTYAISIVLSIFTDMSIPFISLNSAFEGGAAPLIGLGVNVAILLVAALWFIVDFGEVEAAVKTGAPKVMEWYCGYILLTTLVWVYYEAVKVAFRVAILLSDRE